MRCARSRANVWCLTSPPCSTSAPPITAPAAITALPTAWSARCCMSWAWRTEPYWWPRWAAPPSPTTISTWTAWKRRTAGPVPWPRACGAPGPTPWSSPIRATATWPPSVWPSPCTRPTGAKRSPPSSSTIRFYGMTGGQMAPTTLVGQKTTTTRQGRSLSNEGGPVRLAEIMAQLEGVAYAERCALDSVKHVRAAKKAMRKAFEVQLDGLGFRFCGAAFGLPHQLASGPGGGQQAHCRGHDSGLPPGRVQGRHGRGRSCRGGRAGKGGPPWLSIRT